MNRIKLSAHLDLETLEKRYRQSTNGVTRSHWQILWLLARGETTTTVSAMTGYSVPWIRALIKRYNAGGEAAVGDQRRHNPGQRQLLNARQQEKLRNMLKQAAARGERWTGRQVLQRLRMSLQVPRPAHQEADKGEQERFKKTTRR
jgi:transposase